MIRMLLGVAAALVSFAAPQTDLSGTWTLNTYLSDNPEQIAREIQYDTGQRQAEDIFGGSNAGMGGYGRGGSRMGRGGARPAPRDDKSISAEEQKIVKELTDGVQYPPTTLKIAQSENEITLAGTGAPIALHPTGKAEKQTLESGEIDRTTSWEGPELRVAYRASKNVTLRYAYLVVPSTKQLLVKVSIEREGLRAPLDIKLVYDGGR